MHESEIREVWFEGVTSDGEPGEASSRWFRGGDAFDRFLAERFGDAVEEALAGRLDAWAATPPGRLSLVLLLDQVTRNLFRGDGRSFAGDAAALAHAQTAIESGEDRALPAIHRYFLYMPLMHAEDLAVQEQSVACFRALAAERGPNPSAFYTGGIDWAVRHRDCIAALGRFPARNQALGRTPTPEEAAYLEKHPSGF